MTPYYGAFIPVPRELADDPQVDLNEYLYIRTRQMADSELLDEHDPREFVGEPAMEVHEVTEDQFALPLENMSAFWRQITHCRIFHVKLTGDTRALRPAEV